MKDQQKYITAIIFIVAFVYSIGALIEAMFGKNIASFITSTGTIIIFVYGLYYLWDCWLWKQGLISNLISKLVGFYNYPVLDGDWKLSYISSYEKGKKGSGKVHIRQRYSYLFIDGNFNGSSSFESFFAQLKQKENGKWFMVYAYRNRALANTLLNSKSGGMHEGFAYLDVISTSKLVGYYSNDENRKTRGKITLVKN